MSDRYIAVRDFVQGFVGADGGPTPAAGGDEWRELPDADPAKLIAVLTAGTAYVLGQELDALEDRRREAKAAAEAVSEAADWSAVARFVRDRDQALKSGARIERVGGVA